MKHNCAKFLILTVIIAGLFLGCEDTGEETQETQKPNIIYILADDLGYGDVSCLNQNSKIQTENIDVLAEQGMIFTDAHSNSAVCTPTRYGILTGRYAWRTRLIEHVLWSYDEPLIDPDRMTVASLLKDNNYNTACIGKWHLGLGWAKNSSGNVDFTRPIKNGPLENGFDYFFGITASLDIPPYLYIENDRIIAKKIDTIQENTGKGFWREGPIGNDFDHKMVLSKLTDKAVDYVDEQAKNDKPFFLYFPLTAPHTPILPIDDFLGKSGTNEYGDFVLMVDNVVGRVMRALRKNNIEGNTMVIFTSDNGCSPMADYPELSQFGHNPSYHFRGHKADIFEGGHRIPFIVRWPGKVQPGSESNKTICLTDFMATVSAITGHNLPDYAGEDSYNLLPVLLGVDQNKSIREATVHHSVNGSFAIRKGIWKLNFCPGSGGWSQPTPEEAIDSGLPPVQLYNLSNDISEKNNLESEYPDTVTHLTNLMKKYIEMGRSTPGAKQKNDRPIPLHYPFK